MSLITLNSNGQNPSFYANHFPQPIKIPPYSQVCLLKFLHFRDSMVFNITTSNNILMFCIGNTAQDAIRIVRLNLGQYTGAELATEISDRMNEVLQQQNYVWVCAFTPEDDTTSPPTKEKFLIRYGTQATPAARGMVFENGGLLNISGNATSANNVISEDTDSDGSRLYSCIAHNGVITNKGSFIVEDIGFSGQAYDEADLNLVGNYEFNETSIGICRDELANLKSDNVNLLLNPLVQDVVIRLSDEGIQMFGIKIAGNTPLGSPTYASAKLCRTIPPDALQKLITVPAGKDVADIANIRFRFSITFRGVGRRAVVQMSVSYDCGRTYVIPDSTHLGNDPQGNPYIGTWNAADGTAYLGTIWNSNVPAFCDNDAAGVAQIIQNLVITKKAPFKPTFTFIDSNDYVGGPNLAPANNPPNYRNAAGDVAAFSLYTGVHGYKFRLDIDSGKTYYLANDYTVNPTTFTSVHLFRISEADVAFASATFGTALFKPDDADKISIVEAGGANVELADVSSNAILAELLANESVKASGIMNPVARAVSNYNNNDGSKFLNDDEIHQLFNAVEPPPNHNTDPTQVGADLERQAMLFLRQLNNADVAANSGAPANLRQGQHSGTIGSVIGSASNIVVGASSAGVNLFTSTEDCQKISKDTIINISVPELSGVKSFNGIDNGAGQNLSGIGKALAVLPREEFQTRGENVNGSLVYVAPFENWIDVNNANELNINQLSVEVRQPGGQLASDLRPDTITQLKLREDPLKVQERMAAKTNEKMIGALAAATKTGQTLSSTIYNTGS